MASYVPLTPIAISMFNDSAAFLNGGKLRFFLAGTSTPTNVFSDNAGTVIGTEVTLDSRGEPTTFKVIWLDTDVTYKIDCVDSSDVNIWGPVDNIEPFVTASIAGTIGAATVSKSTNYTTVAGDDGKVIVCTGTFTLTLLAAATAGNGHSLVVVNAGAGVVTIDGNSAETINGKTTQTVGAFESAFIFCDGSNWAGVHAVNGWNQVEAITAAQDVEAADRGRIFAATSGPYNVNLPAVADIVQGWYCHVVLNDSTTITINPDGAETINGDATYSISTDHAFVTCVCDGSGWIGLGTKQASTAIQGVVELATQLETQTGTDTNRAVTPDALHNTIYAIWIDASTPDITEASAGASGWTLTDNGTGDFTITHGMGLSSPFTELILAGSVQQDTSDQVVTFSDFTANSFDVHVYDISAIGFVDSDCSVIAVRIP